MNQAFLVSEFKTKKEIVGQALQELVANRMRKNLGDLRGKIEFAAEYDYKAARETRG
jgi:Arc/MetJ family transcription regulator